MMNDLEEDYDKEFDAIKKISENAMYRELSQAKSGDGILSKAKVRVAKVTHIKDLFPDQKPLPSPLAQKA